MTHISRSTQSNTGTESARSPTRLCISLSIRIDTKYTSLPLNAKMNENNGVQDSRFESERKLPTKHN